MIVRFSSGAAAIMLSDIGADRERERCGLLLGEGEDIRAAQPVANVAEDPFRTFELDPAALLAAHRAARAPGALRIIGHYHSHPVGPSTPSRADACASHSDGALWMIIGSDGPRLWRAVAGGDHLGAFEPIAFRIVQD